MAKIIDIAFTAYGVSDMKKARAFYEGVLGLVPNGEYDKTPDSHWVEYNIGQGTLGIGQADEWPPSEIGASIALEVDDFDGFVEILKAKKVPIVNGPNDFPACHMVVIQDPDKNKLTIHKRKKK